MRLVIGCLLLALLALGEKLPPRDDSAADSSFMAFKTRLLAAIQRRDVRAVQAMAEPAVQNQITSSTLTELTECIRLGAVRDASDFIAPYVFVLFPKDMDAYTSAAAVRPALKVHKNPSAAAAVVETLDYDIVTLKGTPKTGWVEVLTPSGKSGWVQRAEVRTQLERRVFFEKKNGAWTITGFVVGD